MTPSPSRSLLSVSLLASVLASGARAQARPFDHLDGTTHWYEVVATPGGITWARANEAAARAGGYLATITSEDENAFVHGLLGAGSWVLDPTSNTHEGPWIGGVQAVGAVEPSGGWGWAQVESFAFQKWSQGRPDDRNKADRVRFGGGPTTAPTWTDARGDAPGPGFVIEYSGPFARRTAGLIHSTAGSFDGYTLLAAGTSTETYLIDPRGRVVNQWSSRYLPGMSAYLLPDGNLLRSGKVDFPNPPSGGDGGIVEEFDWHGNLVWSYSVATSTDLSHHDIERLPNGNTLMIVWAYKSGAEAIAAGRDPAKLGEGHLRPDKIIEVRKTGHRSGQIVWEWNAWDHLIQDHDATKQNFGDPAQHPERVDLNYTLTRSADWMHSNGIAYNPRLDQIMISVRSFEELWIIDHSTTTQEAAGSTGGRSGKGGDLLYRWGNPLAYRAGSPQDKKLFVQHDAHWIPDGQPGGGNILVFSNGTLRPGGNYSTVEEIVPPAPDNAGNYPRSGAAWGPQAPVWTYSAKVPSEFYSALVSGAQRLPNGNTLICGGWIGLLREVTPAGDTVWEYVNPVYVGAISFQGAAAAQGASLVFRAPRYAPDYPAFRDLALVPGEPIELHASVLLADGSTAPRRSRVGTRVDLTLRGGAASAGRRYFVGTSATPGASPIDHRFALLGVDPLLEASLTRAAPGVFADYAGTLDASGNGKAGLSIPAVPALNGLRLYTVFVVEDGSAPSTLGFISNTVEVEVVS